MDLRRTDCVQNVPKRTVLIVSHDMSTLQELCDTILWIHEGEMKEIGEPQTVLEHYSEFMI